MPPTNPTNSTDPTQPQPSPAEPHIANVMPINPSSGPVTPPKKPKANFHLILTIFLSIGMVLFGVLAVLAYRSSTEARDTLDSQVATARQDSAAAQKKLDDVANTKANALPYRTYTADAVDGGFSLQIPKSWSLYAGHNTGNTTQLDLSANPDIINYNLASNGISTQAFKLQILRKSQQEVVKGYDEKIKNKSLTSSGVTVSGISATKLTGAIDDQRHEGTVVILALRDKTMVISSQDKNYSAEFQQILASAKINP